jgi:hypothetical protein
VPRFWVGLAVFGLVGLAKDLMSMNVAEQISTRSDLSPQQQLQLSALAGDKEDFALMQLRTTRSLNLFLIFLVFC